MSMYPKGFPANMESRGISNDLIWQPHPLTNAYFIPASNHDTDTALVPRSTGNDEKNQMFEPQPKPDLDLVRTRSEYDKSKWSWTDRFNASCNSDMHQMRTAKDQMMAAKYRLEKARAKSIELNRQKNFFEQINASCASNMLQIQAREPLTLFETNPQRQIRPIIVKWKPLTRFANNTGSVRMLKALASRTKTLGHWAIEVGPYTHELTSDHGMIIHFRGRWVDPPMFTSAGRPLEKIGASMPCGETRMTDAEINQQAERIIKQMKIAGGGSMNGDGREYNTIFNSCQRFCRRLASAISPNSSFAQAQCLKFFALNSIPTDTIYLGMVGVGFMLASLLMMSDDEPAADGTRTRKLVLRKDPHALLVGVSHLGVGILRGIHPLMKRLEREHQFIRQHGEAAYEIFDRKSSFRMTAEEFLIDASHCMKSQYGGLFIDMSRLMVETRPSRIQIDASFTVRRLADCTLKRITK